MVWSLHCHVSVLCWNLQHLSVAPYHHCLQAVELVGNAATGGGMSDGVGGAIALDERCARGGLCSPITALLSALNVSGNVARMAGGGLFYAGFNPGSRLAVRWANFGSDCATGGAQLPCTAGRCEVPGRCQEARSSQRGGWLAAPAALLNMHACLPAASRSLPATLWLWSCKGWGEAFTWPTPTSA